jgi:hypothetical protein
VAVLSTCVLLHVCVVVVCETEDVLYDGVWEGLDIVVNALDNVNARLYVGQQVGSCL